MYKNYEELINTRRFELSSPEVYNKCIPKYFTQEHQGEPPRINGHRVSWEEYHDHYPDSDFVRDEAFTPAMIYTPEDMNEATSSETVAAMIDLIRNDISFSIKDPETNYPEILDILTGYKEMEQVYLASRPDIAKYMEHVDTAIALFSSCYQLWKDRQHYKLTGQRNDNLTEFDRIEKQFN